MCVIAPPKGKILKLETLLEWQRLTESQWGMLESEKFQGILNKCERVSEVVYEPSRVVANFKQV